MTKTEPIARLIPICQIRPDPAQPRQLLPPDLAERLLLGASPIEILAQLRVRAERDKWTRERLTELDALAYSISTDGLMNPIRVLPDSDEQYRIEEGERRWWAHQILVQQGKEQFQNITAFVVEPDGTSSGLLRRRVAENVLRSDFTAIELARAMAKRMQEIIAVEPGIKQGEVERRVGKENGMSDRRVRQFVALLALSDEAQELAQQARLTENALRPIGRIKDTARQLGAVRELIQPTRSKSSSHSPKPSPHQLKSCSRARKPSSRRTRNRAHRGNAPRTIRKILSLAKPLRVRDWSQATRDEQIRRALADLRDELRKALAKGRKTQDERQRPSSKQDD